MKKYIVILFSILLLLCTAADAQINPIKRPKQKPKTEKSSSPKQKTEQKSKPKNTGAKQYDNKKSSKTGLGVSPADTIGNAEGTPFIVISKRDLTLRVYDRNANGDTILVAQYPCCMGKNKGNKQKSGDMRTPESPKGKPFKITMIQDASTWKHDFKDGRGNIKAYGHWFLRLSTPGYSDIGITGSSNNEKSVPGRTSEGCIRLVDNHLDNLKEHFAYVGMPVIIQGETEGPLPWEERACRVKRLR